MDPRTEVLELLQRHGRLIRRHKHAVYEVNGQTIVIATSMSDKRGWLNVRSTIRRALAVRAA